MSSKKWQQKINYWTDNQEVLLKEVISYISDHGLSCQAAYALFTSDTAVKSLHLEPFFNWQQLEPRHTQTYSRCPRQAKRS